MDYFSSENLWIILLAAFSSLNLIKRGLLYTQAAFKKMQDLDRQRLS